MTIVEFLQARIAEDEARANDFEQDIALALNGNYGNWEYHHGAPANWRAVERIGYTPSRVRAECAAKRAVIALHGPLLASPDTVCNRCTDYMEGSADPFPCGTLRALAGVYKDHPDYDKDWSL